jgi:hypothetical protein
VAHVVQETLDEIARHRSLKVREPYLNLAGAADGCSLRYPTPAEYAAQRRHTSPRGLRDLLRPVSQLDPRCIVTIGDMPSFTNPLAAPYYICRDWIHMDRAADLRGIDILNCFLARYCRHTKDGNRFAK